MPAVEQRKRHSKKRGSYVDYGVSYAANGKQKREWGYTKKAAELRCAELELEKANKGTIYVDPKIKFEELYKAFKKNHIKINCRENTATLYEYTYKRFIKFYGTDKYANSINFETGTEFISYMMDNNKLSAKSINNEIINMKSIFNYAVSSKRLYENPFKNIKALQVNPPPIKILCKEEIEIFLAKAQQLQVGTKNRAKLDAHDILATYLLTGIRRAELPPLEWSDINFVTDKIHVNKQELKGKIGPPKTKSSIRDIDMCMELKAILWRRYQNRQSSKYVFSTSTGKMWGSNNLYHRVFRPVIDALADIKIRLHDLRHTFISMLIDRGESAKYVCEQAGHDSIQTTYDRYGHLFNKRNSSNHALNGIINSDVESSVISSVKQKLQEISILIEKVKEVPDNVVFAYKEIENVINLWNEDRHKVEEKKARLGKLRVVK